MSAIGAGCGWTLISQSATSDAVETALTCHSQSVRYGLRCFEFTKTRVASGDIILRLTESGRLPEEGQERVSAAPASAGLQVEQRVSAVSRYLDEATRSRIEAKVLRAIGRALFRHVACLVDAEEG